MRFVENAKIFSVEYLKLLVAINGLLSISILGYTQGVEYSTLFVYIQAVFVVGVSVFDYGMNVKNVDVSLPTNVYFSASSPLILKLFSVVFISLYFYGTAGYRLISLDWLYMIAPAMFISVVSGVYIQRWSTVCRRSDRLVESVVVFEVLPSILRLACCIAACWLDKLVFICLLLSVPFLISIYVSSTRPIQGLSFLSSGKRAGFDYRAYFISVVVAVRNQILTSFLPYMVAGVQEFVVVLTRVYGVLSIAVSGILSRVPMAVMKYKKGEVRLLRVLTVMIVFSVAITNILQKEIVFYGRTLLNLNEYIDVEVGWWLVALYVVMISGVLISFINLILQSLGRLWISLFADFIYLSLLMLCIYQIIR